MWPFDQNNQAVYQQYAQGYDTGNYNSFNQNQAFGHLEQFFQGAPPDMQQRIYQQHFEQMPYEQRALLAQQVPQQYGMDPNNPFSMSQSFLRMGQEQPQLLRRVFSHPLLLGSGLALTGLIAKHMLAHHQQTSYGQPYDYNYNGGGFQQNQNLRQELNEERREDRELRNELHREERREERLEEREGPRRRREEYY